jgi:3-methyladenine DNA glycosylase AlkD
VPAILAELERQGSRRNRDGMARYGIVASKVFGVSVGSLHLLAKRIGRDHALAAALWKTGWYEAQMLAALVDDPAQVTPAQMDAWARDFENWAICDTVCMHLFDRTPHAWRKVAAWSRRRDEFVRRAAFALLASLALHDKASPNDRFLRALPLIERASTDDRNFVKKGVNWALRSIGNRNRALNAAAIAVAERLARSDDATARWIGKDAVRGLTSPATRKRLAKRP